jgi:hypothetical protein
MSTIMSGRLWRALSPLSPEVILALAREGLQANGVSHLTAGAALVKAGD